MKEVEKYPFSNFIRHKDSWHHLITNLFYYLYYSLKENLPGDLYFRLEKGQIVIVRSGQRLNLRRKKRRYKIPKQKYVNLLVTDFAPNMCIFNIFSQMKAYLLDMRMCVCCVL